MAIFKTLQNYQTRSIDKIEEPVDAEEIYKESSDDPKDLDTEATVHLEAPVAGTKYNEGIHRTPAYLMNIYINVEHINRDDDNTWRTIYEAIDEPYLGEVLLFPKEFL